MEEEGSATTGKIFSFTLDSLKVSRPHVLGSINSKAHDTNINEVIEVVSYLLSDIILTTIKIIQRDQITVTYLNLNNKFNNSNKNKLYL